MPTSALERVFTLCLIALLAFVLLFLFSGTSHSAEAPCTHYASPQGQGSSCTESQPCLIGTFLGDPAKAAPGAVLCLLDGHYTGYDSMLALTSVNGSEGHPITFRAVHDGAVEINGEFGNRPLDCLGSWLTVEGVNLRDGNDTVLVLRGNHCTARRVVAWSTQSWDGIENVVDIGGSHNLLEDCAAFGYARKMIAMGARGGAGPNTVRRCWVEHNGSMPGSAGGNPTNPVEIGYDQDNGTVENVIARRNILTSATSPESPFTIFSTRNAAILGSMAYAVPGDTLDVTSMLAAFPEGGSHAGSGHQTSNSRIQDMLIYVAPVFTNVGSFWVSGSSGMGNVMHNVVAVAPFQSACSGSSWTCTNLHQGTTLEQALGGRTIAEIAPGLCYEVVNRQITPTPLWPWRMEERIKAALASARQPTKSVTAHASRALGTIPPQCLRSTAPPEPGPTPTPGPHPALTCTGTVQAVPGAVSMTCQPQSDAGR